MALPNELSTFFVPERGCVSFCRQLGLFLRQTNSKDSWLAFNPGGYTHCAALGVESHVCQFQALLCSQLTKINKYNGRESLGLPRD